MQLSKRSGSAVWEVVGRRVGCRSMVVASGKLSTGASGVVVRALGVGASYTGYNHKPRSYLILTVSEAEGPL